MISEYYISPEIYYFNTGTMTLKEKLIALGAKDGPNISQYTLAIYTGLQQSVISRYIHDENVISAKKQAQAEKGLRELGQEIWDIVNSES